MTIHTGGSAASSFSFLNNSSNNMRVIRNTNAKSCHQSSVMLSPTMSASGSPLGKKKKRAVQLPEATKRILKRHSSASMRKVRFNEKINQNFERRGPMYEEETKARWFTSQELHRFKALAFSKARKVLSSKHCAKAVLGDAYTACFSFVHHTQDQRDSKMIIDVDTLSVSDEEERIAMVNMYQTHSDQVLGLERLVIPRIRKDKSYIRQGFMEIIRDLQGNRGIVPDEVIATNIASAGQELSRPSRLFSAKMGLAQQEAVAKKSVTMTRDIVPIDEAEAQDYVLIEEEIDDSAELASSKPSSCPPKPPVSLKNYSTPSNHGPRMVPVQHVVVERQVNSIQRKRTRNLC